MRKLFLIIIVVLSGLLGFNCIAHAQAPINSNVAIQPSKGGFIIRQQLRYTEGERLTSTMNSNLSMSSSATTMVYGLSDKLTMILNTPYTFTRRMKNNITGVSDIDSGIGDIKLLSKFRLYRDDFAPASTKRFDLIGGFELPTGSRNFTSDSVNPIFGGVFTQVDGRHVFHTDVLWQFNTGNGSDGVDLFRYDVAFVYRIAPEIYASSKPTAFFGLLELNGFYETNSDHEIFISPGIQYITIQWKIEATVQLPIYQELSNRMERNFIMGVGFRIRF